MQGAACSSGAITIHTYAHTRMDEQFGVQYLGQGPSDWRMKALLLESKVLENGVATWSCKMNIYVRTRIHGNWLDVCWENSAWQ